MSWAGVSHILLWLAVMIMAVIIYALARQIGVLHERIAPAGALMMNQRLQIGMQAPEVEVDDTEGNRVSVPSLVDGKSQLLFFLAPDCPVCKSLLPALRAAANRERDWLSVWLASADESLNHKRFIQQYGLEIFRYLMSDPLGRLYGVAKLPYAVLIDEAGKVASFGIVNSREHLDSLFEAKEKNVASIQSYLQRRQRGL